MNKLFFCAEIGVNHLADYSKAMRMIYKAKESGCTAVKFQKYEPVTVLGYDSPYLKDAHQLSWGQLNELQQEAHHLGLLFGCSVFDMADIPLVNILSDFHKVATRMNEKYAFIFRLLECNKPVYMSIQKLEQHVPMPQMNYFWCVNKYPSDPKECLNFTFNYKHGISSHCPDWKILVAAYEKGATSFEFHVKEYSDDVGCDMAASLTFDSVKNAITEINRRNTLLASF